MKYRLGIDICKFFDLVDYPIDFSKSLNVAIHDNFSIWIKEEEYRLYSIDNVLEFTNFKSNTNKQILLVLRDAKENFNTSFLKEIFHPTYKSPFNPIKYSKENFNLDNYLKNSSLNVDGEKFYVLIKLISIYAYILWKKRIRLNRFAVFRRIALSLFIASFYDFNYTFERRFYLEYP